MCSPAACATDSQARSPGLGARQAPDASGSLAARPAVPRPVADCTDMLAQAIEHTAGAVAQATALLTSLVVELDGGQRGSGSASCAPACAAGWLQAAVVAAIFDAEQQALHSMPREQALAAACAALLRLEVAALVRRCAAADVRLAALELLQWPSPKAADIAFCEIVAAGGSSKGTGPWESRKGHVSEMRAAYTLSAVTLICSNWDVPDAADRRGRRALCCSIGEVVDMIRGTARGAEVTWLLEGAVGCLSAYQAQSALHELTMCMAAPCTHNGAGAAVAAHPNEEVAGASRNGPGELVSEPVCEVPSSGGWRTIDGCAHCLSFGGAAVGASDIAGTCSKAYHSGSIRSALVVPSAGPVGEAESSDGSIAGCSSFGLDSDSLQLDFSSAVLHHAMQGEHIEDADELDGLDLDALDLEELGCGEAGFSGAASVALNSQAADEEAPRTGAQAVSKLSCAGSVEDISDGEEASGEGGVFAAAEGAHAGMEAIHFAIGEPVGDVRAAHTQTSLPDPHSDAGMNGEALGCASGNVDKVPSHLLLAHASGQLEIIGAESSTILGTPETIHRPLSLTLQDTAGGSELAGSIAVPPNAQTACPPADKTPSFAPGGNAGNSTEPSSMRQTCQSTQRLVALYGTSRNDGPPRVGSTEVEGDVTTSDPARAVASRALDGSGASDGVIVQHAGTSPTGGVDTNGSQQHQLQQHSASAALVDFAASKLSVTRSTAAMRPSADASAKHTTLTGGPHSYFATAGAVAAPSASTTKSVSMQGAGQSGLVAAFPRIQELLSMEPPEATRRLVLDTVCAVRPLSVA
jgi:hypothetical protein